MSHPDTTRDYDCCPECDGRGFVTFATGRVDVCEGCDGPEADDDENVEDDYDFVMREFDDYEED